MFISKAQGQTLREIGMLLSLTVLTYVQLYAITSRVGSFVSLSFYVYSSSDQGCLAGDEWVSTENVVSAEIPHYQKRPTWTLTGGQLNSFFIFSSRSCATIAFFCLYTKFLNYQANVKCKYKSFYSLIMWLMTWCTLRIRLFLFLRIKCAARKLKGMFLWTS